eukprot:TRINITY_DN3146_c0_g1::TRINITY_DN3146_c0_g1_i1::g.3695::m.3695 TRINITY_DN3146_c0_g1::TRINITY_DN3146_c0_g1_i1::g.3695  ORF type:complete len:308 (+),score=11.33,sp/Q2KIT4/DNJB4_BOVIN/31.41/3e-44,DnaJ/PF00226.26/1.2e-23,CTDII/PF01556.13/1.2,CTDII/PF01556.13/5.3e-17,COX7a/PF02238.10/1.3e+02,COX7a/PF02238.10/1e+04,COX7a/PF02238.10/3.9 TRINITY_DN3146_c0_g1_i1:77-1000(+)
MAPEDYYTLLGLSRDVSRDQVKKAYKKLAIRWHPDKNPHNPEEASRNFPAITEAFEVLYDPEKRHIYDCDDLPGLRDSNFTPSDAQKLFQSIFTSDIFDEDLDPEENFGPYDFPDFSKLSDNNDFVQPGPFDIEMATSPSPVLIPLQLTLDDLYTGTKKAFQVNNEIRTIDVKRGWKNGTRITFHGKGGTPIPGGPAADLVFVVQELPQPYLKRLNDNLIYNVTLSLREALCGGLRITIPHLAGQEVVLDLDTEVIKPGAEFVVKGKGMPILNSNQYGDLLVNFDVSFLYHLHNDQLAQLKNLIPPI